jgi:hypothetical protein
VFLQKRIHDWSKSLPDWQRDLLRRLAAGPVGDVDRAEAIAILRGAKDAPAAKPLELADLPADESEHGRVELRSIGQMTNINSLAEDETLKLETGLNIVFAKNAAGKTGHCRVLRSVCRAAEREEILPNVFDATSASKPQTVEIVIDANGTEQTFALDLSEAADRVLSAISVFDASCARVYLTKPNVITYVPRPLMLLKSLSDEQDMMALQLRDEAAAIRGRLPQLPELDANTQAGVALTFVSHTSDSAAIQQFAELDEKELAELDELETSAAAIRADTSGQLEAAARTRASGAQAAVKAIRETAVLVDDDAASALAGVCKELNSVTTAERDLANRAFSDQRFPGTGQEAWQEMWASAKRFAEAGGREFPSGDPDPACPVCQQDLDPEAQTRVANFEEFVRSDLRRRVATLEREKQRLLQTLPDIAVLRATLEGNLRDAPENIVSAAGAAVTVIEKRVARARALVGTDDAVSTVDVVAVEEIEQYAVAQIHVAEAQANLRDEKEKQQVLIRLAELKARQALHAALPQIKERIEGLKAAAACETSAGELGTGRVSGQLRKLQEATVTERLRTEIREELMQLVPTGSKIQLVGRASKGETVIELKLDDPCDAKVERVLSTGEQSAVAVAFFLAELAISDGQSAVVFDDPVSSLDHDYQEYLARRLIGEARKRQIVIYTHDLAFLYYLQEAAEEGSVPLHGQTLERIGARIGVVRDSLPSKSVSPSHRRKMLRDRLRFELIPLYEAQDTEYETKADTWMVDLRKGYDQMIEEYVLAGVVRRTNQQVRVGKLFHVKWTLDLAKRIGLAMKKLSKKAHHESPELYPKPPTPTELAELLDEFDAICIETAPKNEQQADEEPAIAETLVAQAQAAAAQN